MNRISEGSSIESEKTHSHSFPFVLYSFLAMHSYLDFFYYDAGVWEVWGENKEIKRRKVKSEENGETKR